MDDDAIKVAAEAMLAKVAQPVIENLQALLTGEKKLVITSFCYKTDYMSGQKEQVPLMQADRIEHHVEVK